jgi:hypothetical protein
MSNRFEEWALQKSSKAKWVKPAVRQLRAGSAETGAGTFDDGDPGGAIHDS